MPRPRHPACVVIIPYYRTNRLTIRLVRNWLRYAPADIRLVLTAARLSAPERLQFTQFAASQPRLEFLHHDDAPAIGASYNRATRKYAAQAYLFVSPGVRPYAASPNLLSALHEQAGQRGAGPLGGLVLDAAHQRIIQAGLAKPPDQPLARLYNNHPVRQAIRYLGTRTYPYDIRYQRDILAVSETLAVSRSLLRSLGGLREDANLTSAQAMVEFCLRANRKGHQSRYLGEGSLLYEPEEPPESVQLPGDLLHGQLLDEWSPEAPPPLAPRRGWWRFHTLRRHQK